MWCGEVETQSLYRVSTRCHILQVPFSLSICSTFNSAERTFFFFFCSAVIKIFISPSLAWFVKTDKRVTWFSLLSSDIQAAFHFFFFSNSQNLIFIIRCELKKEYKKKIPQYFSYQDDENCAIGMIPNMTQSLCNYTITSLKEKP